MSDAPPSGATPADRGATRRALRRAALPLLFVAVWVGWLFRGPLFAGETLFARDYLSYDRPLMALQARLWRDTAGLPEWNPYLAEGQPFADRPMTSPFHPFAWALALLPFDAACTVQAVLPPLVSLLAMFLLLRALDRSRTAGFFGACAWGFGGFVLSLADLLPMARTVAFLPAALAFLLRTVRTGRLRDALGLAAAVALTGLGGEPTALMAGALLGAAALAAGFERGSAREDEARPRARRLGLVAAGSLLGVVMAGAVLIPAAHLEGMTARAAALDADEADTWSLAPPRLLEPFVPDVLGGVDLERAPTYWGRAWYGEKGFPYVFSVYAGLLTAVLALLALAGPVRRVLPWAAAGAVGGVAALGAHAAVWDTVRAALPALAGLRYPEKWALVPALVCVVLASDGLDRLLSGEATFRRRTLRALAGLAAVLVVGAGAVALASAARGPTVWRRIGVPPDAVEAFARSMPRDLLRQAAVAAACLAAVAGLSRRRAVLAGALLAVTAADLGAVTAPLLPSIPSADADRVPPFLAPLARQPRPPRLFHQAAWQPACAARGDVAEPLAPVRWGIPLAFEIDFDLTQLRWTHDATETFLATTARAPALTLPILARRGVGAVLRCTGAPAATLEAEARPPVALDTVPGDRGPAFCVDRIVRCRGVRGWSRDVAALGAAAAGAAMVDVSAAGALPEHPASCTATASRRSPRHLALEVVAAGPGPSFLAVNQSWHPAWRARIDGAEAPLIRTDMSLSGLLVPPGRHTVDLVYRDPWVERPALLSGAAWLVWLAALLGVTARRAQSTGTRSRRTVQRSWP